MYVYVCVHICIRTRMSVTYILPHTRTAKGTPHHIRATHARTLARTHALSTHTKNSSDIRAHIQDTLYVTIQPQYV